MAKELPVWARPALGGAIAGIIAISVVAFSADWVLTAGSAEKMAAQRESAAVVAALKPICVAQFRSQGEEMQTSTLAALGKESTWKQDDFVVEKGWATMPGSDAPNDAVARACAEELMKLAST